MVQSTGDLTLRLCTAAEIRFYFNNFREMREKHTAYMKPNKNCNLTSWFSGCEPGWGCSVGQDQKVDLKSLTIPSRTRDCQPCCEGFFCPMGLTCMIRKYVVASDCLVLRLCLYFCQPTSPTFLSLLQRKMCFL